MSEMEKMIALLNRVLEDEQKAVVQYMHHYNNVRGPWTHITDHFKKHMEDEIRHTNMLTSRIYTLGGTPSTKVVGYADFTDDLDTAMEQDAVAERDAIELYIDVLEHAEETKDVATALMIEAIIDDERHHLDDWTRYLKASL